LNSLRVISGSARGFHLRSVPGDSTRPITDRVKEALFNILGSDIRGLSILDLFGGTGAVGIEALSRGARFALFMDINRLAIETIHHNLDHTRLSDRAQVVRMDSFSYLKQKPDQAFDLIFIAPPQYKELWVRAMSDLDQNPGWLALDGLIIVQIDPVEYVNNSYQHFTEIEQRKYGSTLVLFYEIKTTEEAV
jgi:16S rRNA (guanine966-N2)-methyltransferase